MVLSGLITLGIPILVRRLLLYQISPQIDSDVYLNNAPVPRYGFVSYMQCSTYQCLYVC